MPDHLVPSDQIVSAILLIRGHRVLLDQDLARLYGVETKELTQEEQGSLRSQFVTLDKGRGRHRKFLALAVGSGSPPFAGVGRYPEAPGCSARLLSAFRPEAQASLARPLPLSTAVKVREIVDRLKADGWFHVRTTGSHRHYRHTVKSGTVTLAGRDGDDVPTGTLRAIFRQAGLEWRLR